MDRKAEAVPFLDRAKKLSDYVELARLNHFRAFELGKGDHRVGDPRNQIR